MKKTLSLISLVLVCLLLVQIVYADFEITEGLEITKIRIEIDGDEEETYDYDDEDDIEEEDIYIDAGSDLMIRIDFDNNFNESMKIRTKGILENIKSNGDDITSTSDWYEIEEDDDLTRSWGAEIPSDAEGSYDLEITIYYRYTESNTTEYTFGTKLKYEIHVGESTDKYEEGYIYNLTKALIETCDTLANSCSATYSVDYTSCKESWGICQGSLDTRLSQLNDYKNKSTYYENKFNELVTEEQEDSTLIDECEGEKRVCQLSLQECQSKEENKTMMNVIIGAICLLVGYIFAKKKEKPSGMEQDREGGF